MECRKCKHVDGDECIQYVGIARPECGLIYGHWYRLEDLLNALGCAGNSTTTTTTTTKNSNVGGCICLRVESFNNTERFMEGVRPVLRSNFYKNRDKSELIAGHVVIPSTTAADNIYGSLGYDTIYPEIILECQSDSEEFINYGYGYDLLICINGKLIYARSLSNIIKGDNLFPNIPTSLPSGLISVYLFSNKFDSNWNADHSILAVGGEILKNTSFTITTSTEGGKSSNPEIIWPFDKNTFALNGIDHIFYGSEISSAVFSVSGINREEKDLKVQFIASADNSLSFTDIVTSGSQYGKSITLNQAQIKSNDFLIKIQYT